MLLLLLAMLQLFDVFANKRHDIVSLLAFVGFLILVAVQALYIAVLYRRRRALTPT